MRQVIREKILRIHHGTSAHDDASTIRASGLFMEWNYYARYMSGIASSFSEQQRQKVIDHYVSCGERLGHLPNPFFDPAFFEKTSGCRSLAVYLGDMRYWGCATSEYFDGQYYLETHFADISTSESPLAHFWRRGLGIGLSPHPRIDMEFLRRAVLRDYVDMKEGAWDLLCHMSPECPLNLAELRERQDDFLEEIRVEILKMPSGNRKPHLVFVQAGKSYKLEKLSSERSFDVHINYYDACDHLPHDATTVSRQPGTKVTAIKKLLDKHPSFLLDYEAVLFLDDDVDIGWDAVEVCFAERARGMLDMVQASLTEQSDCFYSILKQPAAGRNITRISAAEIMMPLLSRRALDSFGWIFGEAISGWSVDLLMGREIRKKYGDTVALIGSAVASHCRLSDPSNAFYRYLASKHIIPTVEAGGVSIRHALNDKVTGIRKI